MSTDPKFYSEDVKVIKNIEFCIFTNKEVKLYSSVSNDPFGINLSESYENYEPKKGGLVDLRLGTCDIYLPCTTCGLNSLDCPGHFGHTELAEPVFHYGFLLHLKSLLQCICLQCSKLLIDKSDILLKKLFNKKGESRFKEIKILTKNINYCYNCGTPVGKIKKEEKESTCSLKLILEREIGSQIIDDKTGETTETLKKILRVLSPRDCYNILKNLSDNECFLLGFNPKVARPEDLILTRFPIPPVIIRPTAKIDFIQSSTMEDSLTLKIADIINANKRVRIQMDKEVVSNEISNYNQDITNLLQYHIATYFDNESCTLPRSEFKTGGRPTKSISDRIKSKQGRVRSNLMGKRVDFSARSVITSDPYINIDEVGIPKKIAVELTIPEEVTPFNIKALTELVKRGRDEYPGANIVYKTIFRDGKQEIQKIDLKYRKKAIKLNIGDVVERHSINGDYVLFNRQPTLHKPSMMGHKLHVLDRDDVHTFRVNVSVCGPYNADFDGDEMNIHIGQSVQARNELKRIANVKFQIIGAKDSNPIIGCVQDALSGAYLLTQDNVKIKGSDVANFLCNTSSETKHEIKMNEYYNGQQIFSHIIPKGINNLKFKNGKVKLEIVDGQLKVGVLAKDTLSKEKGSIIHFIWDKYGPEKTRRFIDDSQRLVLSFLAYRGFTFGFSDCLTNDILYKQTLTIVNNKILEYKVLLTQYENDTNQIDPRIVEQLLSDDLNAFASDLGPILIKNLNITNNLFVCVDSKAKGGLLNLQHIMGSVGQKQMEGVRIKKNIESRSLPIYHKDDDTPEARGFIKSSFMDGLESSEFFYDAKAGREGLIDTAIKTAKTGYIQRQLIKGLEDLSIKYDNTNRNSRNVIIQYIYGENGINQSSQTQLLITLLEMNNTKIDEVFGFTKEEILKLEKNKIKDMVKFNNYYINKIKKYRDDLRTIQTKANNDYKILESTYMLPVNLFRLTQDYSNKKEHIELTPQEIDDAIENLLNDPETKLLTGLKATDKFLLNDDRSLKYLLEIALHDYLCPKKCIFTYGLSKKQFTNLLEDIKLNFIKALIEPGEMVGIIAAQSIGEPTSQMTLNTKHSAGASVATTTTSGVQRIEELLHYSKDIKTPQMKVYFDDKILNDKSKVNKITSYFKYLSIKELLDSAEIYYDLGGNTELSNIIKNDNVANPFFINNQKVDINMLPLIFRLKLNIEKLHDKETTLLDIKTKFISYWQKYFTNLKNLKKSEKEIFSKISRCAIFSNNDKNNQIIHIRFNMSSFNYNILTEFLKIIIEQITLKGIDNIANSVLVNERKLIFNSENGNIEESKEYIVYTDGINIEKLKYIKGVNINKTGCNDIKTTFRLYGIEAARQCLLNEFFATFKKDGSNSINHNHMSVLVDMMTHMGNIISIDRHGLKKVESDTITRASFENTMDHFINAAIFNEKDTCNSVSSRILLGRVIPGGTGAFELLLDSNKLENSEYTKNEAGGRIVFSPLEEETLFKDIINFGFSKTDIFIPI